MHVGVIGGLIQYDSVAPQVLPLVDSPSKPNALCQETYVCNCDSDSLALDNFKFSFVARTYLACLGQYVALSCQRILLTEHCWGIAGLKEGMHPYGWLELEHIA